MNQSSPTKPHVPVDLAGEYFRFMAPLGWRYQDQQQGSPREGITLGELESLTLPTQNDPKAVFGQMIREMPVPGMLGEFVDAIHAFADPTAAKAKLWIGPAGFGKTYAAVMLGRMVNEKPPIVVDLAGKDLSELLFVTGLDINAGRAIFDRLEMRLNSGEMHPANEARLRAVLQGHIHRNPKTHREEINWGRVVSQSVHITLHDTQSQQVLDSQQTSTTDPEAIIAQLRDIASDEGIAGAEGIQFVTKEGPLIRAWREGRSIVLDEFSKARPEGAALLHNFWIMLKELGSDVKLAGEAAEDSPHHVQDLEFTARVGHQEFTFRRSEMPTGFTAILTGNRQHDGRSNSMLEQSFYDRVPPQILSNPSIQDWHHRITQELTGLPISTLHEFYGRFEVPATDLFAYGMTPVSGKTLTYAELWQQKPEVFASFLRDLRTMGLSDREIQAIPAKQFDLINQWQQLLQGTSIMAEAYWEFNDRLNPNSEHYQRKGNSKTAAEVANPEFQRQYQVGLRRAIAHISAAFKPQEKARPTQNKSLSLLKFQQEGVGATAPTPANENEDILLELGSRWVDQIMDDVLAIRQQWSMPNLARDLKALMEELGLYRASMAEARPSSEYSAEEALNIDRFNALPTSELHLLQAALVQFLRQQFPQHALSRRNEDVLPLAILQAALQDLPKDMQALLAPNLLLEDIRLEPLTAYHVQSSAITDQTASPDTTSTPLIPTAVLLQSFTLPMLDRQNQLLLLQQGLPSTYTSLTDFAEKLEALDNKILAIMDTQEEKQYLIQSAQNSLQTKTDELTELEKKTINLPQAQAVMQARQQASEAMRTAGMHEKDIETLLASMTEQPDLAEVLEAGTKQEQLRQEIQTQKQELQKLLQSNQRLSTRLRKAEKTRNDMQAQAIALGISDYGFALTTLQSQGTNGEIETTHLLHIAPYGDKPETTLLIGNPIPQATMNSLHRNGVLYIDRTQESAVTFLRDIITTHARAHGGDSAVRQITGYLHQAFFLRNQKQDNTPPANLYHYLTNPALSVPTHPVRVQAQPLDMELIRSSQNAQPQPERAVA